MMQADVTGYREVKGDGKAYGDMRFEAEKQRDCNDVFFLLVWLAALVMTLSFAGKYGVEIVDEAQSTADVISQQQNNEVENGWRVIIQLIAKLAGIGMGISVAWLVCMLMCAGFLINLSLAFVTSLLGLCAWLSYYALCEDAEFISKESNVEHTMCWAPSVVFGILCLLMAMYSCCIQNRVRFASSNIEVACYAVLGNPGCLVAALVVLVVQLAWCVTWLVACAGVANNATSKAGVVFTVFGMLLVFHWGTNINKNIVHVTVSSVVHSLWLGHGNMPCSLLSPVSAEAFTRALTLSFGSICCGSLVTSILQTVNDFCQYLQWMAGEKSNCVAQCVIGCIQCCLSCLTYAVRIFNNYAYSYCAAYGYSYFTAASAAYDLFAQDMFAVIVNDNLVSNVMWMGCLAVGAFTSFLGIHMSSAHAVQDAIVNVQGGASTAGQDWSDTVQDAATGEGQANADGRRNSRSELNEHVQEIVGLMGFLCGYTMCHILAHGTITAGSATVFICFVGNSDGLRYHHPELFVRLQSAYTEMVPQFEDAPQVQMMVRADGRNAL